MPDLLAGTTVNALDTPPTVSNSQAGSYTFTITAYGVTAASGSYTDCGVAFIACTTGRAVIKWRSQLDHDGTGISPFSAVSLVVREGAVVGSGTVVVSADDNRAIIQSGTDVMQAGISQFVTGLTPGDSYNVRLEHRVGTGTGTAERRQVTVSPAT